MKTRITFTIRFLKDSKKLKKKYRNFEKDLLNFVENLENNKVLADRIKGFKGLAVYKARMKNSSILSGKSGGFRVIYYLKKQDEVYLITIYSKIDKENILASDIMAILRDEDLNNPI